MKSIEERAMHLEEELAHLQRRYEQLNDVVTTLTLEARQRDRSLENLADQVKGLKAELTESETVRIEEERPPHY